MKRMRILGLALVAAFAFAALVGAGSASATPGWYECHKAGATEKVEGKYVGEYVDKLCTEKATEAQKTEGKHNKYSLIPGLGKGKAAKTKSEESVLIVTVPATGKGKLPGGGTAEVKCTSSKGSISPFLPNGVKVKTEFKGCTALGSPCASGTKKGTIVTNELAGELGDLKGGGVGTVLGAAAGPASPLAVFTCTEVASNVVFGSLISTHSPVNTIGKESVDTFAVGPGIGPQEYAPGHFYEPIVNVPTAFEGEPEGSHFLVSEVKEAASAEEKEKGEEPEAHLLPSGQKQIANNKGEALMVKE